jgi:hypothetical protein
MISLVDASSYNTRCPTGNDFKIPLRNLIIEALECSIQDSYMPPINRGRPYGQ